MAIALSTLVKKVALTTYSQHWRVLRRGDIITVTSREGTPYAYTSTHSIYDYTISLAEAERLADSHAMMRSLYDN
jgi:hypothetical protein